MTAKVEFASVNIGNRYRIFRRHVLTSIAYRFKKSSLNMSEMI